MPRWRLPGIVIIFVVTVLPLGGCMMRATQNGGSMIPTVKMALVKIPLNGERAGEDVLQSCEPTERFIPEPMAIADTPDW